MEEDINAINERVYKVIMIWHGEENRIKIEKDKEKEIKKEALKMEKAIAEGKYEPYVPPPPAASTSTTATSGADSQV